MLRECEDARVTVILVWGIEEVWLWRVGTGGVLDVCLCLGCAGVGGVVGEWVWGLEQGLEE